MNLHPDDESLSITAHRDAAIELEEALIRGECAADHNRLRPRRRADVRLDGSYPGAGHKRWRSPRVLPRILYRSEESNYDRLASRPIRAFRATGRPWVLPGTPKKRWLCPPILSRKLPFQKIGHVHTVMLTATRLRKDPPSRFEDKAGCRRRSTGGRSRTSARLTDARSVHGRVRPTRRATCRGRCDRPTRLQPDQPSLSRLARVRTLGRSPSGGGGLGS